MREEETVVASEEQWGASSGRERGRTTVLELVSASGREWEQESARGWASGWAQALVRREAE